MSAAWLLDDASVIPEPEITSLPAWQRVVVLLALVVACWSPIIGIVLWRLR